MARKKEYIEHEVIDKAMSLFWRNGYETTSMSMLEKEMGINKFSIYASFGSKDGVFLESIKLYRTKLQVLLDKLAASEDGVAGIRTYFYDFLEFSKDSNCGKGCLVSNTANEFGPDVDAVLKAELSKFTEEVRQLFADTLAQDETKDLAKVEEQADYLIISMLGLANASRLFTPVQLDHYIANIFSGI
ncbi:TetR/AcrR family transcriptional regulator [Reichenbachiella carrageenanivorans]|uniref:TetR/AcrR family transcriptional regulator n=1 Tax=Reichenbachiella carrageenanivorans TaxID=2979869 RepID=A0ABY6CYI5_9BACT|nr:TetR/AcrR family transcriptional regulator [Reichenbachiella carrageenanivorans]UXX78454.1 TetR/AcrR family transcriptional regulator [Reichenbachiella carrageenanivorans]